MLFFFSEEKPWFLAEFQSLTHCLKSQVEFPRSGSEMSIHGKVMHEEISPRKTGCQVRK